MELTKTKLKPFSVVVAYDYEDKKRGQVLSDHKTYELAERAIKQNGFRQFLGIRCNY